MKNIASKKNGGSITSIDVLQDYAIALGMNVVFLIILYVPIITYINVLWADMTSDYMGLGRIKVNLFNSQRYKERVIIYLLPEEIEQLHENPTRSKWV